MRYMVAIAIICSFYLTACSADKETTEQEKLTVKNIDEKLTGDPVKDAKVACDLHRQLLQELNKVDTSTLEKARESFRVFDEKHKPLYKKLDSYIENKERGETYRTNLLETAMSSCGKAIDEFIEKAKTLNREYGSQGQVQEKGEKAKSLRIQKSIKPVRVIK